MKRTGGQRRDILTTCGECGKLSYKTRDAAKRHKRQMNLGDEYRPYLCPSGRGVFHLGELSESIIHGEVSRAQAYTMAPGEKSARRKVDERSHGRCERCGAKDASDYSHRRTTAVRDDHQWCACNATKACRTCHAWAHSNPTLAKAIGFAVSRFETHVAGVPAKLLNGWRILTCSGRSIPIPEEEVVIEYGIPRRIPPHVGGVR